MGKSKLHKLLADYINKDLKAVDKEYLDSFLDKNPQMGKEIKELENLGLEIREMPQPNPSDSMKKNFKQRLDVLEKHMHANQRAYPVSASPIMEVFNKSTFLKIAAVAIIFILGFVAGMLALKNTADSKIMMAELKNTQKIMMLTLLDHPMATDRLKGINISYNFSSKDQHIVEALLATLNTDPNVNVRLSAIDALLALSDNPKTRIGLILAINKQESPLIQSALADAMVLLQEKSSIYELQKLLEKNWLDNNVKKKLENSINSLTKI